jgi:hypothetical protein
VPAVVFVDHLRWGVFTQLAAVVRRSGGRAVRVTTQPADWRNRLIDRLVYSCSIYLDGPDSLANLGSLLADENVVDVQFTEYLAEPLARGDAADLPGTVGVTLAAHSALLDKFVVGELATERGVRTPAKLAADRVTLDEAVETLGLPLVVKARIGASGDMVRIAGSVADARRALNELSPKRTDLFFEQLIDGEVLGYSAAVGSDGTVLDAATYVARRPAWSTGAPEMIQIIDEPEVVGLGRLTIEKLGLTGLVQMDIMRDAQGRCWLLDLNLRAWGSMFSTKAIGLDFGAAYLYNVGIRTERPPRPAARTGVTVAVFPRVVDVEIARHSAIGTVRAYLTHSFRYLRWLGLRYWLVQLMIAVGSLRTTVFRSGFPPTSRENPTR